jgi:hypothetical protein
MRGLKPPPSLVKPGLLQDVDGRDKPFDKPGCGGSLCVNGNLIGLRRLPAQHRAEAGFSLTQRNRRQ